MRSAWRRDLKLLVLALIAASAVLVCFVMLRARPVEIAPQERQGYTPRPRPFEPQPDSSKSVTLQILSDLNGAPIAGASIDVALGELAEDLSDQDVLFLQSDEKGQATLDLEGRGVLQVRAKGYVGVQGRVQFRPGRYVVRLTPAGSLDLVFEGESRKPVEGVEVELRALRSTRPSKSVDELHEDASLLWDSPNSLRISGVGGIAHWSELMPGVEYRWKVKSAHVIEDTGQGPKGDVEAASRGLKVTSGGRPLERVKEGRVRADPGELLRVVVKVLQGCSIQGRIPAGSSYPSVKIFHRTEYKEDTGHLTKFNVEAYQEADESGHFLFTGVRPGLKRLAAQWSDPGQNFYFARLHFGLQPGEQKDVGVLGAQEGFVVQGILKLEGKEAVPDRAQWRGTVHFYNNPPRPFDIENVITDSMAVDVDRPFYIHGLVAGDLQLRAWINDEEELDGIHIEKPPQQDLSLKGPARVELIARLKVLTPVNLTASWNGGGSLGPVQVSMIPVQGGRAIEIPKSMIPDPKTGRLSLQFSIAPNEYVIWARSSSASTSGGNEVFGETRAKVVLGSRNDVQMDLQPGVRVTGRVLGSGGKSAGRALQFTLVPPLPDGSSLTCLSDSQGNYTLHGVPPFRLLRGPSGESVQVGSPGSEAHLDLRLEN